MKPIYVTSLLFLTASLILSSCNLSNPRQSPSAVSTAAAQTVEAALSEIAATAQAPQSILGEALTPTPNGVAIDGTTAEPADCEDKTSINAWTRDGVNYNKAEADKPLAPNTDFNMGWVIQNAGTCVWTDQYKFVFTNGQRITASDTFDVMSAGSTLLAGQGFGLTVPMSAPSAPGNYESNFSLVNARGEYILNVGVITNVGAPSSGSLTAPGDLTYSYTCSGGVVNIIITWADRSNDEAGFRVYRDGSLVAETGPGATSFSENAPGVGTYQYSIAAFNASGESASNMKVSTSNC